MIMNRRLNLPRDFSDVVPAEVEDRQVVHVDEGERQQFRDLAVGYAEFGQAGKIREGVAG